MLRTLNSAILRLAGRPPTLHIGRHVRGSVSSTPTPDQQPSSSTARFGYGVRKTSAKEEEIVAETEPGQRLASFYGHPRLPPLLDEEEIMAKMKEEEEEDLPAKRTVARVKKPALDQLEENIAEKRTVTKVRKPAFDQLEEDVVEKKSIPTRPAREDEDLIDDRPEPVPPSQEIGQYEPLAEPIPAPKRKPRAFLQTYTLTPLVNDSELLRNLVDVGVNLSQFDNLQNVADWLIKLDWEKDVRPVLKFLTETAGVQLDKLGEFVTANPWILQQPIDDLETRIRYLESKKFSKEAITRIVTKAKYWLNFHVKTIDKRVGWLQTTFKLSGDEVRFVVTHSPKLITIGTGYMQFLQFVFKDEMGFDMEEIRQLLLKDPRLWLTNKESLANSFDYVHNKMGLSHRDILVWPCILRAPRRQLKQRHEYLKSLERAQYDPTQSNYVSLQMLGKFSDKDFAQKCAKTSIGEFNEFLKKY